MLQPFSFLQPCLLFLRPGQGPFMYSHALLGKSYKLQTYRLIFLTFSITTSPPCLLCSTIFIFSSLSQLSLLVVTLHILFIGNVDSSHIDAYRVVVSLSSFHHVALIRRLQLERLSHGIGFRVFISDLREFIHSFFFSLEYDLLMTRICAKKNAVMCLYLISYFIEHVLLFEGCLLGLSLRVCVSFPRGLFSLLESLSLCYLRDESFS